MPGMPIHIDRAPFSARLLTWGRGLDGWHGLIAFAQRVIDHGTPTTLSIAAWVPAVALSRPGWAPDTPVDRIALPQSRDGWPAPAGWTGWYAGAWPSGPVPVPDGVEVANGPAWRRR